MHWELAMCELATHTDVWLYNPPRLPVIDLTDFTNSNWLYVLRKLRKCKTEKEKEAIFKKCDEVALIEIPMSELDKIFGE